MAKKQMTLGIARKMATGTDTTKVKKVRTEFSVAPKKKTPTQAALDKEKMSGYGGTIKIKTPKSTVKYRGGKIVQ